MPSFRSFSSLLTLVRTRHTRAAAQKIQLFTLSSFGNIYTDHEEAKADAPYFAGARKKQKIYTGTNLWYNVRDGKVHIFPGFAEREGQVCR